MDEANRQIDKLLDNIVRTILGAKSKEEPIGLTLWPIPTLQGILFWKNEWAEKLHGVLSLIDEQKISDEELKEALRFPSRITHFLWRSCDAVKNSDLGKEERLFIIKKLFETLSVFRKEDLFCENGENIFWDIGELEAHMKDLYFFSGEKLNKLISKLEATLYLYTELLYWANHPLGHSFHGPYPEKEGDLLIREYFDLKPEVWPFSQSLNFSDVEIFEVYERGIGPKIKLEFFERGIRATEPLKQNLEKFALKVDGRIIEKPEQIHRFLENLLEVIKEGSKIIQSLNQKELIEKHANYWFYALKPLCDLVKEDWHPPQQVGDNIYKRYKEINAIWQKLAESRSKMAGLSYEQQARVLRESNDPRK